MNLDRDEYFFTPRYTRGKVSKVLGVTKDTLRHYENCGLLNPKVNEKNGYKSYSIADIEILNVILFLRAIDVPTKDIPKFIECSDIDVYSSFLDAHIYLATKKINHWNYIKNVLIYLKKALDDYKKAPQKIVITENTTFRFRRSNFDFNNEELENMVPSKFSNIATYNIMKLKIIGNNWVMTNRENISDMIVGHLCSIEEKEEDIEEFTIEKSLKITTLEKLEEIPKIIENTWKSYSDKYEFSDRACIVEHNFFNIFNQQALLRYIYFPIVKIK